MTYIFNILLLQNLPRSFHTKGINFVIIPFVNKFSNSVSPYSLVLRIGAFICKMLFPGLLAVLSQEFLFPILKCQMQQSHIYKLFGDWIPLLLSPCMSDLSSAVDYLMISGHTLHFSEL